MGSWDYAQHKVQRNINKNRMCLISEWNKGGEITDQPYLELDKMKKQRKGEVARIGQEESFRTMWMKMSYIQKHKSDES